MQGLPVKTVNVAVAPLVELRAASVAVSCQVTVTAYSFIFNTTQNLVLTLRGTGR